MTLPARHLTVSIERSPADVYAFVRDPKNLPRWAAGLSGRIEEVGGEWVAESPFGRVTVRFAAENTLGVLDHDVVTDGGGVFHNPMRVVPNGGGSEMTFTVFRRAGVSEAELEADAAAVERDLATLKRLLEPR